MKRKLKWTMIVTLLLVAGAAALKLTTPLSYAEAQLRPAAIDFVKSLQESETIDAKECAARYLYYKSDYHSKTPDRIEISVKEESQDQVRVTFYDPSCRDDSSWSSIHRIHLQQNGQGIWIPIRHRWSHKGRGRFGWTTQPTS